jgi:eukaryotic-like serine/threonine-protein kinase
MAEYERVEEVEEPPPRPPWWRENWWMLLILLLLVGGILAFFYLRESDVTAEGDQVEVPDVVGLQERDAVERVEDAGLEAVVDRVTAPDPEGEVISQEPGSGVQVDEGQEGFLSVSAGEDETATETVVETETETDTETETETEEPELAEVPDVVGTDHAEAGAAVEERGLIADSYPVESAEPSGTVVAQNPAAGTQLAEGEHVRLNVALGAGTPGTGRIPDVTGADEQDARETLRDAGFTVRTIDREAPEEENVGEVILQRPEPRTAPGLTQVTIYVGR